MSEDGITLRLLGPDDAPGVAACARSVYGAGYARDEMYDPGAILRRNAEGTWISIVAVDAAGRVVAHLALEPSAFGPVAETSMGMVLSDHRRHGLLERLRDRAIDEAARRGLRGYFVEVNTENLAVQGLTNRSPVHPCGITLGLWPRSSEAPTLRRIHFIRYFRYLTRPARVLAHVPPRHEDILARIYAEIGVPLEIGRAAAPRGVENIVVQRYPRWQTTFVTVTDVGLGTCAQIEAKTRAIRDDAGMETAYLELPLADPGAGAAWTHAEALGWFFAGVAPWGAREGDAIRLQWRRRAEPISEPEIAHPFARALCDYIARAAAEAR